MQAILRGQAVMFPVHVHCWGPHFGTRLEAGEATSMF